MKEHKVDSWRCISISDVIYIVTNNLCGFDFELINIYN